MGDGRSLGGRYEIGEVLGYGGMAEVHRGHDVRLGREVAVKTLRVDLARDPSFQVRFRREAQSAASLNHPSIVAVYDTGEDEVGAAKVPYIVMEYVEGRTLRDVLNSERRLSPDRALEITAEICRALDYSHRNGIVHRDIKPGNVMLTPSGDVKVMDFGIARAVTSSQATMTQTAAVIGTAQYLSPEQARGEHVDARSDIYSTGCLLYELLTGSPPFTGDSPVSVAYQHVREDPVPPAQLNPDIPPEVDSIVLKAMAKNPANRYQDAGEMRADIERARAGQPVLATPVLAEATTALAAPVTPETTVLLRQPAPERGRRRGLAYLLLALAVLAVFAVTALLVRGLFADSGGLGSVPDVRGRTQAQAESAITANGLRLGEVTTIFSGQPAGRVLDQSPPAGTQLRRGGRVNITVSRGSQQVSTPNVVGQQLEVARQAITAAHLTVGNISQRDSDQPAGEVLGSDPAAGATVAAGSKVNLVVASGSVKVPGVLGQTEAAAQKALNDAGFNVNTDTVATRRAPAGTVVRQSPAAGATVAAGTTVTITVARTPAFSPTPSTGSPSPSSASPSPTPSTPSTSPTPTPTGTPTP